jgi:ATP-dependent Lon protease
VILPAENEPDLEELPAETRGEMHFTLADSIQDVFAVAFDRAAVNGDAGATSRAARTARTS